MSSQSRPWSPRPVDRPRRAVLVGWLLLSLWLVGLPPGAAQGATVVDGFQETVVFGGLTQPIALRFAPDGRIFVAEKSGTIKVYENLAATTPTIFADLRQNVFNTWDRGLMSIALDPQFATRPYVYALYTHDAPIGGTAPTWGEGGAFDFCPSPPGPNTNGCLVSGRLSRLSAAGQTAGPEQVLIEDWCQQYPSHSVGSLVFGRDGALYVSAGDGASFTFVDYGQRGSPPNPCGDPPSTVGTPLEAPTAMGGALRSQSPRRHRFSFDYPISLDGTVLRVDPATGEAMPDNPLAFHSNANMRRIIAFGLRNPFRMVQRPNTDELWLGDVGWANWEEINRIQQPADGVVENFGWPCYEGHDRQPSYAAANLTMCQDLYNDGPGAVTQPFYTYRHSDAVVPGDTCAPGTSSISGIAFQFYDGTAYPAEYRGALFFADYSRSCIWAILADANGQLDPRTIRTLISNAAAPVDLQVGPDGDLYYVDIDGGTIRRLVHLSNNSLPIASFTASTTAGPVPLEVTFDASGSRDTDAGDTLTYAWDLEGDGYFNDSNRARVSMTYFSPATITVRLRVTDRRGASSVSAPLTIHVGVQAPQALIAAPEPTATWQVGQTIFFAGFATQALPPSAFSWSLLLHHCPSSCHTHPLQTFTGVTSGSFVTPDHEYPSQLELRLTTTTPQGLTSSSSVMLQPRTADLILQTSPPGLPLAIGSQLQVTPFRQTVIVGSNQTISAPNSGTLNDQTYTFAGWADGGGATRTVTAPAGGTTYTATYQAPSPPVSGNGLQGAYYATTNFSGPAITRIDPTIDFNWAYEAPLSSFTPDSFSVRWTGQIRPQFSETYTFSTHSDDGIRLWVDNQLIIDNWTDHAPAENSGTITLQANQSYSIRLDYYENGGYAIARLLWSSPSTPRELVPQQSLFTP